MIVIRIISLAFLIFCGCATILKQDYPYQNRIIFSFDDGPNGRNGVTDELLTILKKYDVKAFFCLIADEAEKFPELTRRIYAEGHEIVYHSTSHDVRFSETTEEILKDIEAWKSKIRDILGDDYTLRFCRPAGGFLTANFRTVMTQTSLKWLPVSFYNFDAQTKPSAAGKLIKDYKMRLEKDGGGMVVIHDGYREIFKVAEERYFKEGDAANRSWVPGAVEEIILYFRDLGYNFNIPDSRRDGDSWY